MVRATLALVILLGLANGRPAGAAPATPAPSENPFDDKSADVAQAPGGGESTPTDATPAATATSSSADEPAASSDAAAEEEGGEADDDEEPDSALHALTCLEGDATGGRRKGVQRRDFLKRHRFELSAVGGFYASDALSSTYSYGGALAYYPSEDFGVEVLVTRSPIAFRLEEPFSAFDHELHFPPGVAWQGMFSLLWSPIHAKFRFTEQTIVHGDLFVVAGAGKTFHDTVLGLTWEAGAGFKLYLARYLALRFDLRDFLLPQEVLGRERITNNVTVLAGLSAWFG